MTRGGEGVRALAAMLDSLVEDWSRERPDLPIAHKEIVYSINVLRLMFNRHADALLGRFGLDFNRYSVLASLRRGGAPFERAPSELAAGLGFTAGGMSNLLRRLEAQGLVRRAPAGPDDRRRVRVRLTPAGRRLADRAMTALTLAEARHFAALDAAGRRRLLRSLKRLVAAFVAG